VITLSAGIDANRNVNNYASSLPLLSSDCLRFEESSNGIKNCDILNHQQTGLCFLPARRYASAGLCDSDVSVCLSVRRTPVLCLAE